MSLAKHLARLLVHNHGKFPHHSTTRRSTPFVPPTELSAAKKMKPCPDDSLHHIFKSIQLVLLRNNSALWLEMAVLKSTSIVMACHSQLPRLAAMLMKYKQPDDIHSTVWFQISLIIANRHCARNSQRPGIVVVARRNTIS